jgi:hypothetical protein
MERKTNFFKSYWATGRVAVLFFPESFRTTGTCIEDITSFCIKGTGGSAFLLFSVLLTIDLGF